MRFEILGPIRVYDGAREVAITARGQRILLAMLLLNADRTVPSDLLINAIWPGEGPQEARNQLQQYVLRLRRRLADAGLERSVVFTDPGGYRIAAEPDQLDLLEFRRLVGEAHAAAREHRLDSARRGYRAALALWRGPALGNVDSPAVRAAAAELDEERMQAVEERVEVELALGEARELLAELDRLTRQQPYRETLHGAYMLALYRAGRPADALAVFRRLRRLLRDELGLEPGRELQDLHKAMLDRDPSLDAAASGEAAPALPVPRELPVDATRFTGRDDELKALTELLPDAQTPAAAVVVSVIAGTAGVGKTALAVHWGHRVADRFPDGQLFIDLHGFAQTVAPVEPGDALGRMLRALGVPDERVPVELDDRARLWRTTVAGRRMLIVLDNAAAETQVTPLLPGSAGCLVLVTSRRRLSGVDATHTVTLDVLSPADAVSLFASTAGEDRLATQPQEHVIEVVELCGRLPLALRIAATRLRLHPVWSVADLAERLQDEGQRLGELADRSRGVATALDVSYRQLTAEGKVLYRLLGLHPGADVDAYAAAALAGTGLGAAQRCLDQLLDAHLVQERATGRFVLHDLIRVHASRLAAAGEVEPALGRLLDYYRHTAAAAMDAAYPYERAYRPRVPPVNTPTPELSGPADGIAWLDCELSNLLAAARIATERGWPGHTRDLSKILRRYIRHRGRYHAAGILHEQALLAARVAGDRVGEADALASRGRVDLLAGRYEAADESLQAALTLARAIRYPDGELEANLGLGGLHQVHGRLVRGLDYYQAAAAIARSTGDRLSELDALRGLATGHRLLGHREQAIAHLTGALEVARAVGYSVGELDALIGLGNVHRLLGGYPLALDLFEQALKIAIAIGDRTGELNALACLGEVHRTQGRYEPALGCFRRSREIARTTGYWEGELRALIGLGGIYRLQHRYDQAADDYSQALRLARQDNDANWQFEALHGLGRLHHATGTPDAALADLREALTIATDLAQPADQARAHDGIAYAYLALDQPRLARQHWRQALDILDQLGADHTGDEETSAATIRVQLSAIADAGDP